MNIESEILCDSINPWGVRLTTFKLKYPRFIHSELMTHRAFSRNAASSRAIPFKKLSEAIAVDTAVPEWWGSEKPGMQSGASLEGADYQICRTKWLLASNAAVDSASKMKERGLHKSICNRLIEPFSHITVIVTAADKGLANFFGLRAHPDAQPEFQVLAYRMLAQYLKSKPRQLPWDAWHIPYQDDPEYVISGTYEKNKRRIEPAVGRIARVSYLREDSDCYETNMKVFHRCKDGGHWSPFEHVAMAWGTHLASNFDVGYLERMEPSGRILSGWKQFRTLFPEQLRQPDLSAVLATKPDWINL